MKKKVVKIDKNTLMEMVARSIKKTLNEWSGDIDYNPDQKESMSMLKSAHKHKQEQDKAARERFAAKKLISAAGDSNKSVEKKPEKKVEKPVKKKPTKPAVIKTYEPDATPRRGRKPSNIMIPSLAFRVAGEIIVIKNVKNTLDAIEKLSNKKPGYDFWSKSKSIAARISQEKRKLSEPTLFSDQEINEMVEACMKRLLG